MTGKKIVSNSELINNIFIRFPPAVAGCAHSCSSRTVVTRLYSIKVRWWKLCSAHDKDSKCDLLYFCVFLLHFLLASRRRFVFQTEISGNYIVLVLISLLFYFFSSLRRWDQSTVFCILSIYCISSPIKRELACVADRQNRHTGDFVTRPAATQASVNEFSISAVYNMDHFLTRKLFAKETLNFETGTMKRNNVPVFKFNEKWTDGRPWL